MFTKPFRVCSYNQYAKGNSGDLRLPGPPEGSTLFVLQLFCANLIN